MGLLGNKQSKEYFLADTDLAIISVACIKTAEKVNDEQTLARIGEVGQKIQKRDKLTKSEAAILLACLMGYREQILTAIKERPFDAPLMQSLNEQVSPLVEAVKKVNTYMAQAND